MNRHKNQYTRRNNCSWFIFFAFLLLQLTFLIQSAYAQESSKQQAITSGTGQKQEKTGTTPPSLSSLLKQTVVFIYEDKTPPNSSTIVPGKVLGTAFIVGIPVPGRHERSFPFIVTAKHVVAECSKILVRFTLKSGSKPGFALYDLDELRRNKDLWEYPNDEGVDLIIFRTPWHDEASVIMFPIEYIASKEIFAKEYIDVSDRVMIPCLMSNYPGSAQNYPIFRDGTIALITEENIPLKWKLGKKVINTSQKLIFVNSVLNEGFSGSPVFLWPGLRLTPKGNTTGGNIWLIGIVHGFYSQLRPIVDEERRDLFIEKREPGLRRQSNPPKQVKLYSQDNPGMGIVVPSWNMLDIIRHTDFKKRIQKLADEEIAKEKTK